MIQSVRPSGNGPSGPPDLEALVSSLQSKLGNASSKRPILIIIAVAIGLALIWGVLSSWYTVQPEERAVVKRFGAVIGINDPGLHFKIPFGVDRAEREPCWRPTDRIAGSFCTDLPKTTARTSRHQNSKPCNRWLTIC